MPVFCRRHSADMRKPAMPMITMVLDPPPQYAHRYQGPVIERVLPLAEARRACARMGVRSDACAWTKRGACYIVIPRGGPVRDLAGYRRHEIAHCNGWSHHHARGGHRDVPSRDLDAR